MQPGALPFILATGWKAVEPRATGQRLIWRREGHVWCADTDFRDPVDLGEAGPLECPAAPDPASAYIYRYDCAGWGEGRDRSEIRRYDSATGDGETFARLGLNQWIVWQFTCWAAARRLLALVASELPQRRDGGVVIQHQLGFFGLPGAAEACVSQPSLAVGRSLLVSLPQDCFSPLAVDFARERVLFHGATGYQVVDFTGKRQWRLRGQGLPGGRGGAFHPSDPDRVALGGAGVAIVDQRGRAVAVRERGLNPVWSLDGETLYFAESSGDLWCWDARRGRCERLFGIAGDRHAEVNLARPAALSPDGGLLAVPLARRVRRELPGASREKPRSEWAVRRVIVVADLAAQEIWQVPGGGPLAWG